MGAVVLMAVGGCGSGKPDAAPPAPVASSAEPSQTPSVRPPPNRADLLAKATAAAIPANGLELLGVPAATSGQEDKSLITVACTKLVAADRNSTLHGAYSRTWQGGGRWVRNTVFAYHSLTGTDLVTQVKLLIGGCPGYSDTNSDRVTHHGETALLATPGIDASFAFCETREPPGQRSFVTCSAVLAKGPLMARVETTYGRSMQDATRGITQVASISAEALRATAG